jgi:putative two-component system response regulator
VYAPSPQPDQTVLCLCEVGEAWDRIGRELADAFERSLVAEPGEAAKVLDAYRPDAVLIAGRSDPEEILELLAARAPTVASIVIGPPVPAARIEAILDAGADAYLVSPTLPGQVFAAVSAALRSRTKGKAAAHKLSTYRSRIEEMVDRAPVPMFVKDASCRYRFTNRAFHLYVGMTKEQVIGRRDCELIDPEDAAELAASDRLILAGQESHEGERDLILKGERRVYCTTKFPFRDEDGQVIGVAGVATDITERKLHETVLIEAAIERDKLIDQLRSSRAETVDRLTLALLKRDLVSGQHVSRMAVIAAWLADLCGLDAHRVMLLRSAAPMHDVGKIAIRDDILQKPGPLTMEERAEMERHPRIGFEILDGSSSAVLSLGTIIALNHHENWDGSGYPRGLRGTEIPIEGRICAVADVFDALLSDRPYRRAMSVEQAREVMLEGRGRFFDPEVVDLLLANLDEACALRDADRERGPEMGSRSHFV